MNVFRVDMREPGLMTPSAILYTNIVEIVRQYSG